VGCELRPLDASESRLPEIRHCLEPAKDLFDSFPGPLADLVAIVPYRAAVDR
jgi:hypothetical protein